MGLRQKIREAMKIRSAFDRDKVLRELVGSFIIKSKVNRRLFDGIYDRCRKKKLPFKERRLNGNGF